MSGSASQRACERDELALRGGEVVAFLLDRVLEAAGQRRQQVPGADGPHRALDLLVGRVELRVSDVGRDGSLEHERVLGHDAELGAVGVEGEVAEVDAVHGDGTRVGVVRAREHLGDARLAGAGVADERSDLAWLHGERDVAQHRARRSGGR